MADREERNSAGMDGQESVIFGYFLVYRQDFISLQINLLLISNYNKINHMKTNYERPEAEELNLVLEENFLETGGNVENPDDPGTEIEL